MAQSEKLVAETVVLYRQINVALITKWCFLKVIYPYITFEKDRFLTCEEPSHR